MYIILQLIHIAKLLTLFKTLFSFSCLGNGWQSREKSSAICFLLIAASANCQWLLHHQSLCILHKLLHRKVIIVCPLARPLLPKSWFWSSLTVYISDIKTLIILGSERAIIKYQCVMTEWHIRLITCIPQIFNPSTVWYGNV